MVAAAGEDRVGGRQADERLRGAAVVDAQADVVAFGVAADLLALGGVRLDRDHVGAEPGALHRHRTRARAHVPDRPAGGRAEAGQHERADLRLGDHRVAVLERVLGQRPAVRGARVAGQPARRAGRVVRVEGDEDVGVGEDVSGIFGDAFLRRAEEFDGVDALARGEKLPRPARARCPGRSGWRPWGGRGRRRGPGGGSFRGRRRPGRRPSPGRPSRKRPRPRRRPG